MGVSRLSGAPPRPRRRRLPAAVAAVAAALAVVSAVVLTGAQPAAAAELREVTNFGANPGNARMFIYVPDRLADPAPVVVSMHGCGASASFQLSSQGWRPLADQYGFILVLPQGSGCWSETAAPSIASMVEWTKANHRVDASRVFASGISAGGYMTNQMVARYPRVFAAGSSWSGTPFGCNLILCALGWTSRTPQQWGDAVRTANPGYTGPWPRMQVWHGTQDAIVQPANANEQMEQWTNVHGGDQTADATRQLPNGVTQRDFTAGGRVVVEWFSWAGGHATNAAAAAEAARFFGIDR